MVTINLITDARVALVWLRATIDEEDVVRVQRAVSLYKKINDVMTAGRKVGIKESDGKVSSILVGPVVTSGSNTATKPSSLPVEVNLSGLNDIEELEELSKTLELSKIDTINRALVVYAYLAKERSHGGRIIFEDKFGLIKKLEF